jgi:hypothetical protein
MFRKGMTMKAIPIIHFPLAIAALYMVLLSSGCTSTGPFHAEKWFRGNTHTHTLRSDGDAAPEVVVKWYHDRNYNFLIITDHNKFIDPKQITMPADARKDFLLIPGEEITGRKAIHTTAMNINKVASWKYNHEDKSKIIQFHVDEAIKAGGTAILNHPNFGYAVSAEDILAVDRLYMFELFNGHPSVHNAGDHAHPSTEDIWDRLLTEGKKIFAVAADDAHHYQVISPKKANPCRGWVMVQAAALDADIITKAMLQGDFYASTGVFLKTCNRGHDTYQIEVDDKQTKNELTSFPETLGVPVKQGREGYRIEFIGPSGEVLNAINGKKGHFKINRSIPYVRAKVTLTRKHPKTDRLEEYYAWGQPVFTDARASKDAIRRNEHNKPDASDGK